jgi:glycosyltransferase involved in cell wall biosynthesis
MPEISILISTFNRRELVKRAIDSVIGQTFTDFELFIIDDESTDGTQEEILRRYPDKRLKYIYNERNEAKGHGDKVHIRRLVHELARGKYWISLNSDDFWIPNNLLARQIALFEAYPDAAMVTGGQESYFVPENRYSFTPGVFPHHLDSDKFLEHFASDPIHCNIIIGARLYNRELFIKSGALVNNDGRWESGYELNIAPGCYGSHIYIDEPCVLTEIRPENASFNETQLAHYLDAVASTKAGFRKPLLDFPDRGLREIQRKTIENIGIAYVGNGLHVMAGNALSYCSPEHLSRLVAREDTSAVMESL